MPDPLEQDALGRSGQFGKPGVAGFALRATELHLDEFMVQEGTFCFGDDGGSDSGIAY